MQIRVWHLLLVIGVVWYVVSKGLPTNQASNWAGNKVDLVKKEVTALKGLFHSGEAETKKLEAPPPAPAPQQNRVLKEVSKEPRKPKVAEPIKVKPKVALKKPAKKVKKKRRVRKKKAVQKKKVVKKKAPAVKKAPKKKKVVKKPVRKKKAKPTDAVGKLLGSYVNLELKTGNIVKGVFVNRTKDTYVIELPMMGPFSYPKEKVLSISAAN